MQVTIPWMVAREAGWNALCRYWASEEFKENSKQRRKNRGTGSSHTYGGDGHLRLAKRIVSQVDNLNFFLY